MRTGPAEILLIEDNPADIFLFREALANSDWECNLKTITNGDLGFAMLSSPELKTHAPDLIVLDLNLPGRSGHEILRMVKDGDRTKRIPVIVMSSSSSASDIQKAYESHANCYVVKSGDVDEFFGAVKAIEHFWLQLVVLPEKPL